MKNIPPALLTFLNSNNEAWRADLFTLTTIDGTVWRWTTCDRSLVYGGNTFVTDGSVLSRSNLRVTSKLEVDTLEVTMGGPIVLSALDAFIGQSMCSRAVGGYFDGARLQLDHLIGAYPGDVSLGAIKAWYEGAVAGVDPSPDLVKLTVKSDLEQLTNTMLPKFTFQPGCAHAVYDPNCALVKASFMLAGVVDVGATTTSIPTSSAALLAQANDYFDLGVVIFTSGPLNGVRRAVKTWTTGVSGVIVPALPLKLAPAAGTTFNIYPGCDRTAATCVNKFNNFVHFRGFPHVPATEAAT